VIEDDVPNATIKEGIILLIEIFILYLLNMKSEQPNTVNANEKAKTKKPGNKLNVLKVNHERLITRIHERHKSINFFGTSTYLEEKRLKPITRKLMFNEKIGFNIIK